MMDITFLSNGGYCPNLDYISQFEVMEEGDFEIYIKNILLPILEKSYQDFKEFIKNKSRFHVYNMKKILVDMLEGKEVVKIPRQTEETGRIFSKNEAAFQMLESLSLIYLFATIVKTKTTYDGTGISESHIKLTRLIREIRALEADIYAMLESRLVDQSE